LFCARCHHADVMTGLLQNPVQGLYAWRPVTIVIG